MQVTCAGILFVDIIAADLPKVSNPGELIFAPRGIEVHTGGHAGNVSIDLRKLGVEQGHISTIGAVGRDVFGDFLETILKKQGIITHLQIASEVGTSKDLILVVKGEDRRFHVDNGANWYLSPEYVLSVMEKDSPVVFYVGGVGLTGMLDEQLPEVLKRAKNNGCLTFVDPVTPYKHGWDFIIPSLKWMDIFHCNIDEAKNITGEKEPRTAAGVLTEKGANLAIISLGDKGLIARTKTDLFEMPAFKVQVVDPTGAGDALCAGIIYGLLEAIKNSGRKVSDLTPDELIQILLYGEAAGAACVTKVGTTTAVNKENVEKIMKEQKAAIVKHILRTSQD